MILGPPLARDPLIDLLSYHFFARRKFRLVTPAALVFSPFPFSVFSPVSLSPPLSLLSFNLLGYFVPRFCLPLTSKPPPRTSPFRANSKAIRMAPAPHTQKRKTFSLHQHACPLFRPGPYRSCLFVRGHAFSHRSDFYFVLLLFCPLSAPLLFVLASLFTSMLPRTLITTTPKESILKAKKNNVCVCVFCNIISFSTAI